MILMLFSGAWGKMYVVVAGWRVCDGVLGFFIAGIGCSSLVDGC